MYESYTQVTIKFDQVSNFNFTSEDNWEKLNDSTEETSKVVEEPALEHNLLYFLLHQDFSGLKQCLLFWLHSYQAIILSDQNCSMICSMSMGWSGKAFWTLKYWCFCDVCLPCYVHTVHNLHNSFNPDRLSKAGIIPIFLIWGNKRLIWLNKQLKVKCPKYAAQLDFSPGIWDSIVCNGHSYNMPIHNWTHHWLHSNKAFLSSFVSAPLSKAR